MASFALKARYLFPVDRPPLTDGVITVDGERIAAVGENTSGRPPLDLGNVALLPGLVNAHTHLEFSALEKPLGLPGMSLPDWIRAVIAYRSGRKHMAADAIARGLGECIRSGTTTIGDVTTLGPSDYPAAAHAEVVLFFEAIGFSSVRAESAFQAVLDKIDQAGATKNVHPALSPHAPYTVHPQLITRLVELSRERELPLAMHLAESPEETQLLETGQGAFRDLLVERSMWDEGALVPDLTFDDYIRPLSAAHRALVIHGNYLDRRGLKALASHRRMSLIYCPRTHAFFGHKPYPLVDALRLGVNVALGTDSRASNPDLSLLEELRFVRRNFPELSGEEILGLGTIGGARALGRDGEIGTLLPGKWANLTAILLAEHDAADPHDLVLGSEGAVVRTWFRGKPFETA